MSYIFQLNITLNNGASYKISSNGNSLSVENLTNPEKSYTFDEYGKLIDHELESLVKNFDSFFDEIQVSNHVSEPTPPEFMTKSQIKSIMKEELIDKYFGLPDRSFHKYWIKDSKITSKWHFNKVVYLIRQHLIPLKFKSTFWNTRFFTDNDAHMQKFFIDLKKEIDDLIENQS
jgi:hypothetical protein